MGMREKLIELTTSERLADYLIANGVTIPVRCENCKKGHPELAPNGGVWCAKWNHVFCNDGFCSFGEKGISRK